jgi:glycerol-3-phosphate acyltransferase
MAKKSRLLLAHKLFSAMLSLLLHGRRPPPHSKSSSTASPAVHRGAAGPPTVQDAAALVVDVDSALLRSGGDLFPYFMLVALEAGGFLRGLVLLLLCPLIRLLMPHGVAVRAMALVSFCGLRAGGRFRAGRAVLPKWLMEDVAAEAFEAVHAAGARRAVCVTAMPRVMVDGFLREYLGVETVVAREMKVVWGFYTGLMEELPEGGEMVMKPVLAAEESDRAVVGFSGSMEFLNHPLARCCKV